MRLGPKTLIAALLASAVGTASGETAPPLLTPALGGDTTTVATDQEAFTLSAANMPLGLRRQFEFGNQLFDQVWQPHGTAESAAGLGPLFNADSCAACHINNGRGFAPAGPDEAPESMLVRISALERESVWVPLPHYGDQIQDRSVSGFEAEATVRLSWATSIGEYGDGEPYRLRAPTAQIADPGYGPIRGDVAVSVRVASPLIGLGLLEMVPEETLYALADPEDENDDGISGRVNIVFSPRDGETAVGRFGWKANSPNLTSQNASAAFGDIGLTSPIFPEQHCPTGSADEDCSGASAPGQTELSADDLRALNVYTRRLAVPRQRTPDDPDVNAGYRAFLDFGCGGCHQPSLITGEDPRAPDLSNQTIHPFTDLLLHDMGEGLADNRPDFLASGREWRTAPLWGIGLTEIVGGRAAYLHDGRARTLAEAILWHDGEAAAAKERFRTSAKQTRNELIKFLKSL